QPIAYPAQAQPIETLLSNLATLEWKDRITDQELKDRPNAQAQFGFTKPQYSILLEDAAGNHRLEVGDLSPMGDEVFLSLVGGTAIYLTGADLLKDVPANKDQWRDPALLNLSNVAFDELTVRTAARELQLRRDPANHLWFLVHPVAARADTAKITDLLENLQALPVSRFVSDDPKADLEGFGLQSSPQTPYLTLVFSNGPNRVAELQMGSSPTNAPGMVYARRLETSNIVMVARETLGGWQGDYTNFLDQHFISLSPGLIESIETHGEDDFIVRKNKSGEWKVEGRENFLADGGLMEFWLSTLTNITTAIEKTVVADFTEYGLTHPALRYAIQFNPAVGSNSVARLEFGTNKTGQVFERRTDEDFVNTIGRDEFGRLPQVSWQLRDRHIWNFESSNVVSVTIHQDGATRKYLRDPEGEWTFAPGYHGPPFINTFSVEEGVHRIGKLTAIYWDGIGDDPSDHFGFRKVNHSLEFEVKRPAGVETLRIEFGVRSPYYHPYAAIMRNGQRLIFEFPADLYDNFVEHDFIIPAALRVHPQ
ncbi:MAG TPA: DUF4340 domain-containing protein, partial [Verrucomicrobiae bacterium]|nr:DUF4340 domain-containing protein [Verrucomicrobiae bacterium]